jgi:predicted RNase H-like nuclease (RuvC/YqgF family)
MSEMTEACTRCGRDPAPGYAYIDGRRYCHEDPQPTCYMRALRGDDDELQEEIAELRREIAELQQMNKMVWRRLSRVRFLGVVDPRLRQDVRAMLGDL